MYYQVLHSSGDASSAIYFTEVTVTKQAREDHMVDLSGHHVCSGCNTRGVLSAVTPEP